MATYYHDSTNGDDANNGLTAVTPKKTLPAAVALCTADRDILLSTNGGGGEETVTSAASFTNLVLHYGKAADFVTPAPYKMTSNQTTGIDYSAVGAFGSYVQDIWVTKTAGTRGLHTARGILYRCRFSGVGDGVMGGGSVVMGCAAINCSGIGFRSVQSTLNCVAINCGTGAMGTTACAVQNCLFLNCTIGAQQAGANFYDNLYCGCTYVGCTTAIQNHGRGMLVYGCRMVNCDTVFDQVFSLTYVISLYRLGLFGHTTIINNPHGAKILQTDITEMASHGLVDLAGGDYSTSPTAELLSVGVQLGLDTVYATSHADVGLQALITGGGGTGGFHQRNNTSIFI
jgi:hypothetical protein